MLPNTAPDSEDADDNVHIASSDNREDELGIYYSKAVKSDVLPTETCITVTDSDSATQLTSQEDSDGDQGAFVNYKLAAALAAFVAVPVVRCETHRYSICGREKVPFNERASR